MDLTNILRLKHAFFYIITTIITYYFLASSCFVFYGLAGNPVSSCSFLPDGLIVFLIEYSFVYVIASMLIAGLIYWGILKIIKRMNIKFTLNSEIVSKYFGNILTALNISLALFFCFWQLLLNYCLVIFPGEGKSYSKCSLVPVELGYDYFYIFSYYLAILLFTICFFLFAPTTLIKKANFKYFFLTINIIFIAFLFFEV